MKLPKPSLLIPWLVVLVPLLVLTTLAAIGIRMQWTLAGNARIAAARSIADVAAFNITTRLQEKFRPIPRFADPPPPGPVTPEDDPLQSNNFPALRAIRDNPSEIGVTPAGLPRRAIAAARILNVTDDRADAEAAVAIVTGPAASAVTSKILAEIGRRFSGLADDALSSWVRDTTARAAFLRKPEIDGSGEWREDFYITKSGDNLSYFHKDDLLEAIDLAATSLGTGTTLRVSLNRDVIAGPPEPVTEQRVKGHLTTFGFPEPALETVMLPYGGHLQLNVLEVDMGAFNALVHRQTILSSSLLALAVLGTLAGLWIIHRALTRERKLNAMKSDFVAAVSHELRAPIGSIRLMADALRKGKLAPAAAGEFHHLISRESARLSSLIENILDFARIDQGRREWKKEETDLAALARTTLSLMEPLAVEKQITLSTILPENATATVDPGAIQQAIVNLLDNAIKFSAAGSTANLVVEPATDAILIRVTDHGTGIPASEHNRIFEKFHRLGGELRRETQGTGIGLTLVKAIAEAHRGSISVESEPGKGSTFTLTLPAA